MKTNFDDSVAFSDWNDWKWQLKHRIRTTEELEKYIFVSPEEKYGIASLQNHNLPMVLTPYFASLMDKKNPDCPIRKQVIPSTEELVFSKWERNDPCGEENDSPVPFLVHRYPDRVLLIATQACAAYCRYCTRRRLDRRKCDLEIDFEKMYRYIQNNKNIRDVLISGGDPLLFETQKLEEIIKNIRRIPHVEIIRLGTRVPTVLPQRIDEELVDMLKKYQPLYLSIHFSHYKEITETVKEKCTLLADNGLPLGSQTVILKGINDSLSVLKKLFHELLKIRVKPYYLYQCDLVQGIEHFRTPLDKGIEIIENLRGHTSGYAIPTFVIDAPQGGGKVPVGPNYIISKADEKLIFRNYRMKVFQYPTGENIKKQTEKVLY